MHRYKHFRGIHLHADFRTGQLDYRAWGPVVLYLNLRPLTIFTPTQSKRDHDIFSNLQVTNLRWWRWRLWSPRFWDPTDCPPCQDGRTWNSRTASHCAPVVASGSASPRGSRQPVTEPADSARQVLIYSGRCVEAGFLRMCSQDGARHHDDPDLWLSCNVRQ
jgi:hypothetical protein